jgi:protein kinase-like protein
MIFFLDTEISIKVGGFGLATLIKSPGKWKKTIYGTPNYIVLEMLFDIANGCGFEVDTWSIRIVVYMFVIGHPSFQTKDIKEVHQ